MIIMRKVKISQFIGRQLSRLKAGQTYYAIAVSTIAALSLVSMAFRIEFLILVFLFPAILFGAFFIGLFMDKSNITSMDQMKTIEMTFRYLNTADYKIFEFNMMLMKTMFKWMESIQKGVPMDPKELENEYRKYAKKWEQPDK